MLDEISEGCTPKHETSGEGAGRPESVVMHDPRVLHDDAQRRRALDGRAYTLLQRSAQDDRDLQVVVRVRGLVHSGRIRRARESEHGEASNVVT